MMRRIFRNRGKWAYRIQVAGLMVSLSFMAVISGSGYQSGDDKQDQPVTIYAKAKWYRARSEPEKLWRGTLVKRTAPVGPNTRNALKYSLCIGKQDLAVYAAGVEEALASFLDQEVSVRGKLVDLSEEDQGKELWIASIRSIRTQPQRR
ncbi:MAG TPA: hypothetical protein VGJ55_01765 [Pyrinomonadaceae bacterium]|jgi:hypothetical protein